MTTPSRLDLIGDVHGELPALAALGRELGYRVDGDWTHPDGRPGISTVVSRFRGALALEPAVGRHRAFG